jgi:hypothetical protein
MQVQNRNLHRCEKLKSNTRNQKDDCIFSALVSRDIKGTQNLDQENR